MPPEDRPGIPEEEEPRPEETASEPGLAHVTEQISHELSRIHEESYGEEPAAIKTYLLEDAVVAEIGVTLMPHERTILEAGLGSDGIKQVRGDYQGAIRSNFIAAVERMTGRRVIAFLSDTHVEPTFSVEYFKLESRGT